MIHPFKSAFITAAGRGERLRPLTDALPKPLVPVGGVPILDRVMAGLEAAGVGDITLNIHHLGDAIRAHLADRRGPRRPKISAEETLLDTGGGVFNGLELVKGDPFFVVSGDSFLEDGPGGNPFARLAAAWDEDRMDILLLLQPVEKMTLTPGIGDYTIGADGRCARSRDRSGTHMFTSTRLCRRSIFNGRAAGSAFSFLDLFDAAERQGRLFGLVHDGAWHHITTPQDWERTNAHFAAREAGYHGPVSRTRP